MYLVSGTGVVSAMWEEGDHVRRSGAAEPRRRRQPEPVPMSFGGRGGLHADSDD
jgi:hypothetical protein